MKNICSKYNKNYDLIKYRIKNGKTIEEAMEVPYSHIRLLNLKYKNKTGSMRDLCKEFDKDFVTVYNKIKYELKTFEYAMDSTKDPYKED